MKDGVFNIVLELLLAVIVMFFVPIVIYGMEEERMLRECAKSYAADFLEVACNQKNISEENLKFFYTRLAGTGLNCNISMEVVSDEVLYQHDTILAHISDTGSFELKANDYIEVIIQSENDTTGVKTARMINPFLAKGWIRIIKGSIVYGYGGNS